MKWKTKVHLNNIKILSMKVLKKVKYQYKKKPKLTNKKHKKEFNRLNNNFIILNNLIKTIKNLIIIIHWINFKIIIKY